MYDVEKHSAPLENAAGFAKLDAYIYSAVTKCTTQNTTGAHFLEVQIHVRILVYGWDP